MFETLKWYFQDLKKHQPDCSIISDETLKKSIFGRWQAIDGKIEIPYTFAAPAKAIDEVLHNEITKKGLVPVSMGEAFTELKENVRLALQSTSEATKGAITFVEVDDYRKALQRGFSFNVADFDQTNLFGVTYTGKNEQGFINNAQIFFNNTEARWNSNSEYWKDFQKEFGAKQMVAWLSEYLNTVAHELLHGLGLDHLHDQPEFVEKIQDIADGQFCSVMPYSHLISSPTNTCQDECTPAIAVLPGPLDKRMLEIAYEDEIYPMWKVMKQMATSFERSFSVSGSEHFLQSFLEHVKVSNGKNVFSPKQSELISDAAMLAALLYLELPGSLVVGFTFNALVKYSINLFANEKGPSAKNVILQELLAANLLLNLLSLSASRNKIFSTLSATFAALVGGWSGNTLGSYLGQKGADLVNYLPQLFSHGSDIQSTKLDVEASGAVALDVPATDKLKSDLPSENTASIYQGFMTLFADRQKAEIVNTERALASLSAFAM